VARAASSFQTTMSSSISVRLAKGALSAAARRQHLSSGKSPRWCRAASVSATQEKDPQLGDYPELPWQSSQTLPPRGWWDQQMRRNFGDPVSVPVCHVGCNDADHMLVRSRNAKKFYLCGALISRLYLLGQLCSNLPWQLPLSLALVSSANLCWCRRDPLYRGSIHSLASCKSLAD